MISLIELQLNKMANNLIKITIILVIFIVLVDNCLATIDLISQLFNGNAVESLANSEPISTALTAQNAVNFSCLDLLNYLTQLFNEYLLKPLTIARQSSAGGFLAALGGPELATIYTFLISLLRFFQITLDDLRTQMSGIECLGEKTSFCRTIDSNILSQIPKKEFMNTLTNQLNFFFGSNYNYNPLFALWNTGYLFYKCFCRTC